MTKKLFVQAMAKFFLGTALVGLLIFLPAGSLRFGKGWLLMGILFIPMFLAGIVMMLKNPALLEKRLSAKEERGAQRIVVAASGMMFLLGFILAGLNHRFGWHILSNGISIAAAVLFLLAYAMYGEVLRENTYLSRTIEVQAEQKVIDTGLYGIVRHPMYSSTIILFLTIPLVLGSLIAFVVFLIYPFLIAARIKNEEELLESELPGYRAYKEKVKYRLIPFIW